MFINNAKKMNEDCKVMATKRSKIKMALNNDDERKLKNFLFCLGIEFRQRD